jgi:hypothetical protein
MGEGDHKSLRELQCEQRSRHVVTRELTPYPQIDTLLSMQAREKERSAQGRLSF